MSISAGVISQQKSVCSLSALSLLQFSIVMAKAMFPPKMKEPAFFCVHQIMTISGSAYAS